ncbi:LysR family transcriptional regulator [Hirschia litorea]|uniref:LysR family transcriptional regulator n=1 Tax=Hirschia litorea TaxID=1199156 RepID=A0ABW2IPZ3_9PROT
MADKNLDPLPILSKTYLQPNRLEHFMAVYETQNVHRAAQKLNVSQQAVSKTINKLEDTLQVDLFVRLPTGVQPTQYADHLARRARLILSESRLATLEIDALRGSKQGTVRVGCGPSMAGRLFPLAIERMRGRNKNYGFTTYVGHTQKLMPLVLSGEIEFAIVAPPASVSIHPELEVETLYEEYDIVIGRSDHPLLLKPDRTLQDYQAYPWVASHGLSTIWTSVVDIFSGQGVDPPNYLFRTDSMAMVIGHVMASNALCMLCREAIQPYWRTGDLAIIPHSQLVISRNIQVITRKRGQLSPVAKMLKSIAIETIMSEGLKAEQQPKGC